MLVFILDTFFFECDPSAAGDSETWGDSGDAEGFAYAGY